MNDFKTKFFTFVLILFSFSTHALDVPKLRTRVTDLAGLLSTSKLNSLEKKLKKFEHETSNQIAVLIIESLEDENLEDYSHRVAETWKLGQSGKDNGVLLLIAKNDRKLRIEVGYGLESILTDALSNHIIQNEIVPHFKAGDFETGISKGVVVIMRALQNTYRPALKTTDKIKNIPLLARFSILIIWLAIVGIHSLAALFNKSNSTSILNFFFLIPFWYFFPPMIFGSVLGGLFFNFFIIGFPILWLLLRFTAVGKSLLSSVQFGTGKFSFPGQSRWARGSSSSFRLSGGRSSRSSFSGGGGSFGGGGSSGSW